MPSEQVWFCHACELQVQPLDVDGVQLCPHCASDFLESVDTEDPELLDDPHEFDFGYDDLPLPGSFPRDRFGGDPPSRTAPAPPHPANGPVFRFGFGGGSITVGGSVSGGPGRRSGYGAQQGTGYPTGLRTSHDRGVPTLSDFLNESFGRPPARAGYEPPFGPPLAGPSSGPRGPLHPAIDMHDAIAHVLDILGGPNSLAGRGRQDDPYFQLIHGQGGLRNLLGGPRGSFGDYATSQEAFDHIVTQLAQAAGPSANRPPPASQDRIDALAQVPIDSVLLQGMDEKACSICMSDFLVGETAKRMPCTHLFHDGCIATWLVENGTCPVCRYSLVTSSPAPSSSSASLRSPPANGRSSSSSDPAPSSPRAEPSSSTSLFGHLFGSSQARPSAPSSSSPLTASNNSYAPPSLFGSQSSADPSSSASTSALEDRSHPPLRRSGAAAGTGVQARGEPSTAEWSGFGAGGPMDLD